MNKTELVNAVAEKADFSKKDADKAVAAVLDSITDALAQGDKVQIVGFGTFEVRARAEKQGRNPKTGEAMIVPASNLPAFKAGKALKEAVAKKENLQKHKGCGEVAVHLPAGVAGRRAIARLGGQAGRLPFFFYRAGLQRGMLPAAKWEDINLRLDKYLKV